ncbi:hypothetical protein M0805_001135 [Coniferiporia weirii]|nr:hypothetical protein M0805_001135 [Coniferiporia weirii]
MLFVLTSSFAHTRVLRALRHNPTQYRHAYLSHKGNRNQRRFLVKWTGYPSSENQWLSKPELSHATKILKTYKTTKNL